MKTYFQMRQLTVICANVSVLIFRLNLLGVELHHLRRIDELTASFCVRQSQYRRTVQIVEANGGKILKSIPGSMDLLMKGLLRRPVLIFGGLLLLFLTMFIPTRVLFVTVTGNEQIPKRQIIAAASECGIRFGASRSEIRSERVKNLLLTKLPELKWAGVNTQGCVAQISVRERVTGVLEDNDSVVSSMVASRDGVITEMTVRNGTPLCRVGQAVEKGQLLVSGYSDCGRCIYATRADAEIYALTSRNLRLSMLTDCLKRETQGVLRRKYGLVIGKKRINFYKGSGIYDTTCVRMYVEYPLTLPGGFQLPIVFVIQEEIDCPVVTDGEALAEAETLLIKYARAYLESQTIAGEVKQEKYRLTEDTGAMRLYGQYICDEMIARTHNEEIVNNYEQTD